MFFSFSFFFSFAFLFFSGQTTTSPKAGGSGSTADASLIAIIASCSFLGVVLLIAAGLLLRRVPCRRAANAKTARSTSDSSFQVYDQEGFDLGGASGSQQSSERALQLQRQTSLRTKEDLDTFKPVTLGRMESVEESGVHETEFGEDADLSQYSEIPKSRLTRNPAYAGANADSEHQYADVGPADGSEQGDYAALPHQRLTRNPAYDAGSGGVGRENTYERIAGLSRQASVDGGEAITPVVSRQQSVSEEDDLAPKTAEGYDVPRRRARAQDPAYETVGGVGVAGQQGAGTGHYAVPKIFKGDSSAYDAVPRSGSLADPGYDREPYRPDGALYDEVPSKLQRRASVVLDDDAEKKWVRPERSVVVLVCVCVFVWLRVGLLHVRLGYVALLGWCVCGCFGQRKSMCAQASKQATCVCATALVHTHVGCFP